MKNGKGKRMEDLAATMRIASLRRSPSLERMKLGNCQVRVDEVIKKRSFIKEHSDCQREGRFSTGHGILCQWHSVQCHLRDPNFKHLKIYNIED